MDNERARHWGSARRVDPFIPTANPKLQLVAAQPILDLRKTSPMQNKASTAVASSGHQRPPVLSRPHATTAVTPRAKIRRLRRTWAVMQWPLVIGGGLVAGYLVQSPTIGQIIILVYGLVAFLIRIPSRITFVLAFLSLGTVVVLLTFKDDPILANTFATYVFLLLAIGALTLAREARATRFKPLQKPHHKKRY